MALLELKHVSKSFAHAKGTLQVLGDITFSIEEGEFIAIVGPSGCGKSTLLRIINGIVPLSSGQVLYRGRQVASYRGDEADMQRVLADITHLAAAA